MNTLVIKNYLMSRGMMALLVAQFLSAMADNVLFVAAIAMLKATSGDVHVMSKLVVSACC